MVLVFIFFYNSPQKPDCSLLVSFCDISDSGCYQQMTQQTWKYLVVTLVVHTGTERLYDSSVFSCVGCKFRRTHSDDSLSPSFRTASLCSHSDSKPNEVNTK